MSLTKFLKKKGSPLHTYINQTFPSCLKLIRKVRTKVMDKPTITPKNFSRFDTIIAGNAIDYRIRLYFERVTAGNLFIEHMKKDEIYVAAQMVERLSQDSVGEYGEQFLIDFYHWVKEYDTKELLSKDDELKLLKYIIILSHYDIIKRAGEISELIETSIESCEKEDFVEVLFSQIENKIVDDLYELSSLFFNNWMKNFKNEKLVLNPTFKGSRLVGGGDADLIIGNTLIEIKSTADPKRQIQKTMIQQLLSYTLLDLDNEYKIEKIGIYFARQGHFWNMDLKTVLKECGSKNLSIKELRTDIFPTLKECFNLINLKNKKN